MKFSNKELVGLAKAWIIISIAFAILLNDISFNELQTIFKASFILALTMSAATVGLGFLLHELAHKYLAQKYGCKAEFRPFDTMLILTLAMSLFGFVLAAPGAVFIQGNVNLARNGRISAVGPLVNIALAIGFFAMLVVFTATGANSLLVQVASYGLSINGWLAVFNLLPFWHLDGSKVFAWNKKAYAVMLASAIGVMFLHFFA